ncbi:DUF6340 family protein [Pontibacter silvestris]|uniref:DUF6340 family protein n=1 Tax=Pontibacter silvestris TaxID=2305183 RepID=A0ABW4WV80_9BACT|nr:DUF6340 family protein [Pontibacter silvestris]MCC9137700.1 DUF6340 family protein [Pontibacter silvestris]
MLIQTSQPAAVPVTDDQWKVAVLNRLNADLLPYQKDRKVDVFRKGAESALQGVIDAVLDDSTFVLVMADSLYKMSKPGQEQLLTEQQVQELYASRPYHLLLTLDNFDAFLEKDVERNEDENGAISKTAHYALYVKSKWTLYDSTGTVLDQVELEDNEYYQSREVVSGLLAIGPAISNAGETIKKLAQYTGYDYWQRFYPQQINKERNIYVTKILAPAALLMQQEKWAQATELLLPIATDTHSKDCIKAAYNLAVAYEGMGKPKEAAHWAALSESKGDKKAKLLLAELLVYK